MNKQRRLRQQEQQRRGGAISVDADAVVQPIAERTIADLIVILQADDELRGRQARGIGAARPAGSTAAG